MPPPLPGVKTRTSSVSSQSSNSRPSSPLLQPASNDPVLKAILAKLDTIDKRTLGMETDTTAKLVALDGKMDTIRSTIDTVSTDVAALMATTGALSDTSSLLIGKTDALASENELLRKSVIALEARVDQLTLAGTATALCNPRTLANRRNELTVSGLSFEQANSASLLELTTLIANALHVETRPGDFVSARLLRKVTQPLLEQAPASPRQTNTKTKTTYAVVCKDSTIVNRLLSAKRTLGVLKYSQLDADALAGLGAAMGQAGDCIININELLPSHVLRLLADAKARLKAVGIKHIWARNLTVMAKYTDDSVVQIINTPADIPRIVELYSAQLDALPTQK